MTYPYLHENGYRPLLLFLLSTLTAKKSLPKDMSALFCTKCEMLYTNENIVMDIVLYFCP